MEPEKCIEVMYGAIRNMNNTHIDIIIGSLFSLFVDVFSAYAYWLLTPTTWWSKQGLYNASKLSRRIVII